MRMSTAALCLGLVGSSAYTSAEYKSPEVMRAENILKTIIGLNHDRCAEIVYVTKLQGSVYGVTCIKIAGRPARIHYAVDGANNAVVRLDQ